MEIQKKRNITSTTITTKPAYLGLKKQYYLLKNIPLNQMKKLRVKIIRVTYTTEKKHPQKDEYQRYK